jgi:hypothetical protein
MGQKLHKALRDSDLYRIDSVRSDLRDRLKVACETASMSKLPVYMLLFESNTVWNVDPTKELEYFMQLTDTEHPKPFYSQVMPLPTSEIHISSYLIALHFRVVQDTTLNQRSLP